MRILEILGVEGDEWTKIMKIAEDAAARGWWESSARRMGPRQARTADLEAGAATIQEYAATYPPGLLQTPAGFSFPCQCGEHTNQKTQIKAMNGSSPRARGAPGGASTRHAARRVIPACAGSALPDLQISRGMFGSVAASVPTHRPFSAAEWMSLLLGLGWPQADRIRGLFKFGEAAIAQPPPGCLLLGNRRLAAPILASDRAPPGGHDPSRT